MTKNNGQPVKAKVATMADVLRWVETEKPYSGLTMKDYLAQLNRCPVIYNANRLEDVSADIAEFRARFSKRAFPAEHFKTAKSSAAWRKKMISLLKAFHGVSKTRSGPDGEEDQWDRLLRLSAAAIAAPRGMNSPRLIPIKVLAKEARRSGRGPDAVDVEWLEALTDQVSVEQRRALASAVRRLEQLRKASPQIDAMLPPGSLPNLSKIRRAKPAQLTQPMAEEIERLVAKCCEGQYDEILDEHTDGKSAATASVYTAALKKYVGSAYRIGALPEDCKSLSDAFSRPVFNAVIRQWIMEPDGAMRISNRTMRSYIGCLILSGTCLGASVNFMCDALKVNRNLLDGKEDARTMPRPVKIFCARLLRERVSELRFKSLHLIFQRKSSELALGDTNDPYARERIVQYGVLACYAAISLWSAPLRIGNMRTLRHLGKDPTLILPHGSRKDLMIVIPARQTKNRRTIRAPIQDGPTRAVEVVNWYLREIRPMIPWSDRSDYLFPGYHGEIISPHALRNWLYEHTRDIGLPMIPHNFRHGLASLYLRDHPGEFGQAARLLWNTPDTVRNHYAWIDEEAEMRQVQIEVARLGRLMK